MNGRNKAPAVSQESAEKKVIKQEKKAKKRFSVRMLPAILISVFIGTCGVLLLYPAVHMLFQTPRKEAATSEVETGKTEPDDQELELNTHYSEVDVQGCRLYFDENGYITGGLFENHNEDYTKELVQIEENDKISGYDARQIEGVERVICMQGPYYYEEYESFGKQYSDFAYEYYAFGYDSQGRLLVVCKYLYDCYTGIDDFVLTEYKIIWGEDGYPVSIEISGQCPGYEKELIAETQLEHQIEMSESGDCNVFISTTCNEIDYLGFNDDGPPYKYVRNDEPVHSTYTVLYHY